MRCGYHPSRSLRRCIHSARGSAIRPLCNSAHLKLFKFPIETPRLQVLAKKMIAIMELSQQQMSKQDHYDYSLRCDPPDTLSPAL